MSSNLIHRAAESETSLFCDALQEWELQNSNHLLRRVYADPTMHARSTNCGTAPALVQHGLKEHHGIETARLAGEPPKAPRKEFTRRAFRHILLQHENYLIDPTYGQLASWMGLSISDKDTVAENYPENLSLVVDTNDPEEQLEPLVNWLLQTKQLEHTKRNEKAPLRNLGRRALSEIVYDIYDINHYASYELAPEHISYEQIQALICISERRRTQLDLQRHPAPSVQLQH